MRIAVIGAGNVGGTLGAAWAKRGHEVVFGVREPNAAETKSLTAKGPRITVAPNAEAAARSDIVVLTTPWPATQAAVESCGNLAGKAVIDCTNPLKADLSGLEVGLDDSGAERVARWAQSAKPGGAQVFKAMNQIGFNNMDGPRFKQGRPVMFVCGDGDRKPTILHLIQDLGFDAVDAGGLKTARLIEPYGMLWIHLALRQGLGRNFAFGLLRE